MEIGDYLLLTKQEAIDPKELIDDHFKSSYLNSYLKYLDDIKKLNLGIEKNKITKEIYKEALKDYVSVRLNWINHQLGFKYNFREGKSLSKYYTPEREYEIPSRNYLISLSSEELRDFLYTLPTR